MSVVARVSLYTSGLLKRYGPSKMKKVFWDREFASEKWDCIDNTVGDPVYTYLTKHIGDGRILDLGCGPGNTATELDCPYRSYVGVDISEVAIEKARRRTEATGRTGKNHFVCSDFLSYDPGDQKFDVILFRESMYHVPVGQVKPILDKYTRFLTAEGVFMVRLYLAGPNGEKRFRPKAVMRVIEAEFDVVDKFDQPERSELNITVFRPHLQGSKRRESSAGKALRGK